MIKFKFHLIALLAVAGIVLINSCTKEEYSDNIGSSQNDVELRSNQATNQRVYLKQDENFNNLARVVSVALHRNEHFRKLIKSEVLKQFDGDYNVLIAAIKDRMIFQPNGVTEIPVKQFLGDIYRELSIPTYEDGDRGDFGTATDPVTGDDFISDPDDFIDYITSVYPIIQIAIPEHVDDWNEDNYVPTCTYIPDDLNEGDGTQFIDGYNNNILEDVDVENVPDNPVVVIGMNERIRPTAKVLSVPDVTISLSASTSALGISLTWTVSNPNDDDIMGFRIYRKTLTSSSFEFYHDNVGENNTIFDDNDVESLLNYHYYVVAYNAMGESQSSNTATATAPSVPSAASDFSANHFIKDEIELRWSFASGQYIQDATLFERVIGVNGSYVEIGTFPSNIHDFIDTDIAEGKKVIYKLEVNNNQGNSNPKYDFVEVPYRDVSTPSTVRIHKVSYDKDKKKEIEGWLRGKPEIMVSIAKAGQTGDAAIVQEEIEFDMKSESQTFDKFVSNWLPGDWAEVYTFKVVEEDGKNKVDLSFSAGFDKKDSSKTAFIKGGIDVKIEDIFNSKDDNVGRNEHRFRSQINEILEFTNGGVEIELSN
ncbi:MAG: fibronectin type III domain-containing protein [Saprospiraceae bacterium]